MINRPEPALSRNLRTGTWAIFAVLVVFACSIRPGWDLTASFVAGRLAGTGHGQALYQRADPVSAAQPAPLWDNAARQGGIADGLVTPYVQTPLWAWLISPLATHMRFSAFKTVFAWLLAVSVIATLRAGSRQWAPRLASAGWQATVLAALCLSVPFLQALFFSQTHALFLCLTVLAACACLSGRQLAAGVLLALAASVKITPAWLALTWLTAGQWRASASFTATALVLAAATVLVAGQDTTAEYLHVLQDYSRTVCLAFNNDSLATVILHGRLTQATVFQYVPVPLPEWIGMLSAGLIALAAIAGGWVDRRSAPVPHGRFGAVITLVAATAFTPLAWDHYFIVLLLPEIIFLQACLDGRGRGWAVLAVLVLAMVTWPVAYTAGASLSVVARRSEFWAAMLCIGGLGWLALVCRGAPTQARKQSFFCRKGRRIQVWR